jgi:hypothetical protein
VPALWIVEFVVLFEEGDLSVASRSSAPLPQQLSFDRLEVDLDRRVVSSIKSEPGFCVFWR